MKITIRQIAEEAGVSMTTVSNVVNKRQHRVSQDKIEQIEKIIKKYNYTPNMNARALVQSSSNLIGLLYYADNDQFNFADPFVAEVLEGIEQKARALGYFTLVHAVVSVEDVESVQSNWKFEGFIGVGVSEEFFEEVNQRIQAPVVFLDTHLSDRNYEIAKKQHNRAFVNTNDYEASYKATNFLIEQGHQDIAFFTYPFKADRTGVIRERYRGYLEALENAGLDYDNDKLFFHDDFEAIAKTLDGYSAIVVTADFLAVELIHYLKERNLYDKEKTSIIGFDDIRYARLSDPPLTTIRLDSIRKGELGMETLHSIIQDDNADTSRYTSLDGELVIRKSVSKK
ncbi:LacI family transcriptional regulator [Listeria floridensis FSL S10-1187]|uniref:LacI family transcriptional regulator n=1 Tax=Listeria floridensis FSL S10-1187 TaxID=1265817 RepID=A0ABN0RII0_9LIST|nr:LacI family DNA-binding transcriptional regulator [Listeria floridensis]EUJ33701.1 LacI family transcriptional regulator [Listeria floridensis FSL S10-1187]